jgi:replicative DNA helicase
MFSLEMSKQQLGVRLLCSQARVDSSKVRTGYLAKSDWPKVHEAGSKLSDAKMFIDDSAALSVLDVRARARRLAAEQPLGLIIIDYLQLMHGREGTESRQLEVSDISRGLKALAKEINVPIIALSQLSRAVESRTDKRPMLSDLRESGSIEQDADVVMFIYRDVVYNPETDDPGKTEILLRKQRNGPIGDIQLHFENQFTRFFDRTVRNDAPPQTNSPDFSGF